ncbi:LOW QUALITY PROTEIN: cytoplasmic 60S subunit biogenesis factor REI1 [Populus alba x Populus x berolinensis]|nr:LOW QUALITY PROTEIN: cytoplasmic 60S subunit biogenesis factor REI1 [Populus alba x Populus x berolinensis]
MPEFDDDAEQKLHYKSEWHRYNLKRKVAGVPGVTEALFVARQSAIAKEKEKNETLCFIAVFYGYRSSKAHDQHLKSRSHILRASQGTNQEEENTVIKPLPRREVNKRVVQREAEARESEESEDEWEEVDSDEELVAETTKSLTGLNVNEMASLDDIVEDDEDDDPQGLLTYLGLKVKRDFMCLYCNDKRQPFNSLEAVRKHMEAKKSLQSTLRYVAEDGRQLVASGDMANTAELGSGGSELIITTKSGSKVSSKTLGSREYLRYYRQKPRPSHANHIAIAAALASRYRSMGLTTVQSREQMVRMKSDEASESISRGHADQN